MSQLLHMLYRGSSGLLAETSPFPNGTNPNPDDSFCGAEGFAWYFVKDGKFLSDCVRELFLIAPPFALFLILGWVRLIELWDMPVVNQGFKFWTHPKATLLHKLSFSFKTILLVVCTLFIDFKSIIMLVTQTTYAHVFYLVDLMKFLSWCLCSLLFIMEHLRNRPHWFGLRLFWISSFISGCFKQTQMIRLLADKQFSFLDVQAIIFQVVFVANFLLTVYGLIGICANKQMEYYYDEEVERHNRIQTKKNSINVSFKDILTLFGYGWYLILPGVVFAVVQGVAVIEISDSGGKALGAAKEGYDAVNQVMLRFLWLVPIAGVGTILQMIFLGIGGEVILAKLRNRLFLSFTTQDMSFFNDVGTGFLVSRLTTDTDIVGTALTVQFSQLMPPLVELLYGIYKLIAVSWRISLLMNGLLLITFIITTIRSKLITARYSAQYSDCKAVSTKKATECIYGFSTIRTFGKDHEEMKKYSVLVWATTKVGSIKECLEGIFEGIEVAMNGAIIAIFLYFGSDLVLKGINKSSDLDEFFVLGVATIRAFLQVVRIAPEFYRASGSAARILQIIHRKPRINIDEGEIIPEEQFKGQISFKNVTFSYLPADAEDAEGEVHAQTVLSNYNLDIKAGETVALVGSSGSGKSTILSLILRFYDVQPGNGSIEIDGVDIRNIKARWLLAQIGVVSQMPTLFDGSIEENIKYSCFTPEEYADDNAFWNAVDGANAKAVLESHDEREKFNVGEGGENLSGGQRQRISIARCIRKNPKLLILDEVTSALDPESEAQVMVGLKNLMKGKTSVIVAHRLHTVVDADKIVVMHRGKIVEMGNHQQLMAKDGVYADLFKKQQVLAQMQPHSSSEETNTLVTEGERPAEFGSLVLKPTILESFEQGQNMEQLKFAVQRLVSSLKSHEFFDNEDIQQQAERVLKSLNPGGSTSRRGSVMQRKGGVTIEDAQTLRRRARTTMGAANLDIPLLEQGSRSTTPYYKDL